MKARLPAPPFYPLEDLARAWGCSVALLRMHAALGEAENRLVIEARGGKGARIEGVTPKEKARFESLTASKPGRSADALAATERTSLLALIGVLSAAWCGCDPEHEDHPYTLLTSLEEFAARQGVPVIRGDDTNARLIAESFALLHKHGYRAAPKSELRTLPGECLESHGPLPKDVSIDQQQPARKRAA
jgi:hypothetical protein